MKKNLLTIMALASAGSMLAQLPVSTSPQNRKAVLEEFTGIYCGYCPDGHAKANALKAANPGNVVLINVHAGPYANVAVGEPDLTSPAGTSINNMSGMGILGYPAGDINRINFGAAYAQNTVTPFGMAQNRSTWSVTATNSVLPLPSYVNVALQGTVNVTTRVLNVEVQVYYTANSPVGTNSLSVFLLEDNIIGPQHNYGSPLYNASNYNPDGTYNHNHALRTSLTPAFGLTIPNTTAGTTFTTMLTYTIPATYGAAGKTNPCLLGNLELAAFVTETDRPIVSGANGPIFLSNFANTKDIATTNLVADAIVCSGQNYKSSFRFTNLGSDTITQAVFSYSMNGVAQPNYTWTGSVLPQSQALTINLPVFNFSALPTNTFNLDVVSVNGGTDQVAANNPQSKTNVILTNVIANSVNMQMDFTQDQYGTEDSWTIYDELTNAVISSDGPFTNLAAAGTQLHTKTFTVNPSTCYKLVVVDAFGDGVNSGYGVGGYIVSSGGTAIITSNGQYGTGETKLYKTSSSPTGLSAAVSNVTSVGLYPNPTSGLTNLAINLSQNETVAISIMNSIGQIVYSSKNNSLDGGQNNISLNTESWSSGVYFVNISTAKGSVNTKLTVAK